MLNQTKNAIKKNKDTKVKKNTKTISSRFLALCQGNWGSDKKMIFLYKKHVPHELQWNLLYKKIFSSLSKANVITRFDWINEGYLLVKQSGKMW